MEGDGEMGDVGRVVQKSETHNPDARRNDYNDEPYAMTVTSRAVVGLA